QVFLSALFQRLRPELSVEVGSFKGGSALRILSALDRTSKRSCLVCIDTFLGDASMWLNRRATGRGSLQLHRGHPQIYEQFMANTQSYADSPGLHRSLPGGLSQWLARASAAGSGGGFSAAGLHLPGFGAPERRDFTGDHGSLSSPASGGGFDGGRLGLAGGGGGSEDLRRRLLRPLR
ncbi:unnamed protein product, partial [Effrenium voratum]